MPQESSPQQAFELWIADELELIRAEANGLMREARSRSLLISLSTIRTEVDRVMEAAARDLLSCGASERSVATAAGWSPTKVRRVGGR